MALVSLLPFTESTEAKVRSSSAMLPSISLNDGDQTIQAENIPTGIYKLVIETPLEYFRDPKGYLFHVSEAGIIKFSDKPLHFEVVAPGINDLPPCRNLSINNEISNSPAELKDIPFIDKDTCMAEGLVDLSNPIGIEKLKSESNSPDFGNYYYAGPMTFQDNQGVWGRNYVVNPGLIQGVGSDQFVAERVYADNGNDWIEAGWIEQSWGEDRQYIYAMDSGLPESIIFDEYPISPGSAVETKVYYNSDIGKWRAMYHLGGANWVFLREVDLGFTIADHGYNRGEAWENIGVLPSLPSSYFDMGRLFIDGVWHNWDYRYITDVAGDEEDDPYRCDMVVEYHKFFIHSSFRETFLPLLYNNLVLQ